MKQREVHTIKDTLPGPTFPWWTCLFDPKQLRSVGEICGAPLTVGSLQLYYFLAWSCIAQTFSREPWIIDPGFHLFQAILSQSCFSKGIVKTMNISPRKMSFISLLEKVQLIMKIMSSALTPSQHHLHLPQGSEWATHLLL